MNIFRTCLVALGACVLSLVLYSAQAQVECRSGYCCMPGECYLFEELVRCTQDEYSCKDGERRIWSYRPLYYARDNSELLVNLHEKLCPEHGRCFWSHTLDNQ